MVGQPYDSAGPTSCARSWLIGARVRGLRPETSTSDVRVNSRGDYLFVNVRISPRARPGDYPLIAETPDGTHSFPR